MEKYCNDDDVIIDTTPVYIIYRGLPVDSWTTTKEDTVGTDCSWENVQVGVTFGTKYHLTNVCSRFTQGEVWCLITHSGLIKRAYFTILEWVSMCVKKSSTYLSHPYVLRFRIIIIVYVRDWASTQPSYFMFVHGFLCYTPILCYYFHLSS